MTKPTPEELKALRKLSRKIDRKRYNGQPLTTEEEAAELLHARLYCQSRANEEGIAWYLTRSADGTHWGMCDWDLEFKRRNGMAIPTIVETYTRQAGGWYAPAIGAV